jgi:hypothetical protein
MSLSSLSVPRCFEGSSLLPARIWGEQRELNSRERRCKNTEISADRKHVLLVSLHYVTRIEVENIIPPSEGDSSITHFRTIRFTTDTGEVLEVFCTSELQKELELVEVDKLGPVRRVRTKSS